MYKTKILELYATVQDGMRRFELLKIMKQKERDGIIMALVTTTEMFKKAYEGGYAIGAFQCKQHGNRSGYYGSSRRIKLPIDSAGFSRSKKNMRTTHTL